MLLYTTLLSVLKGEMPIKAALKYNIFLFN